MIKVVKALRAFMALVLFGHMIIAGVALARGCSTLPRPAGHPGVAPASPAGVAISPAPDDRSGLDGAGSPIQSTSAAPPCSTGVALLPRSASDDGPRAARSSVPPAGAELPGPEGIVAPPFHPPRPV